MSEVTDLVVIEKQNAMAVFTTKEQLDPIIEAIGERSSQPGAGCVDPQRPRRYRIHGA